LENELFPAFVPGQQAGMVIRGLPDQFGIKDFKKFGASEAVECRLTPNRDSKMEILIMWFQSWYS